MASEPNQPNRSRTTQPPDLSTTTPAVYQSSLGRADVDMLAEVIETLQLGDPTAPAVVVCANSVVANGLRRQLIASCRDRGSPGISGVRFMTVNRLAEFLAEPWLVANGSHIASRAELLGAVRAELQDEPGAFGSVADHRTTEERLVAYYQELTGLAPAILDKLEASAVGLAADAIRVARGAAGRMGSAYSEDRLVGLALDLLERPTPLPCGPIALYQPDPVRPYEGRMVQAIARRNDCRVIVGLSGHVDFDSQYIRRLNSWSIQLDRVTHRGTDSVVGGRRGKVIEVAAPDEEVRAALREILAHAASGSDLSQMAVLYTTAEPYAGLLREQLNAAEIPFRGPSERSVAASLAGRTLRRLLALASHGLERSAVVTLLSSAPINAGAGSEAQNGLADARTIVEAPALLWDRISRQAGVVDEDHWKPRLEELTTSAKHDQTISASEDLLRFIVELKRRLVPPTDRRWQSWATWAKALVDHYLVRTTSESGASVWPEVELAAFEQVRQILDRIGGLDAFGPPPRLDTFEASISAELDGVSMAVRDGGFGLFVGPLAGAATLRFSRAAVVGMVEGVFPRSPREDSLLPDQLRARAGGLLASKSQVAEVDGFAAAAVTASCETRVSFYTSRGDLRSNRSRAFPEVLRPLVEAEPTVVASHHEGLVHHGRPVSELDHGLRALIAHVDGGDPVHTHHLASSDLALQASLARHQNRNRSNLSKHTGRVPAGLLDPTDYLFSPTALETYALCPRKYLFGRVLRLTDDERPERIAEITGREKGQMVHQVLDRFITEALDENDVPAPDEPWSLERRARLFEILADQLKLDQSRGVTGGEVRTRLLHQWLIAEMHNFLDRDDELRAERGSTPTAAEYKFGFEDSPGLVELWAGRKVKLRGSVDRVDFTDDGGILVIDYKGGSDKPFRDLETNPLDDGRRLQLPLYAAAVAERLDRSGPKVGLYWLTTMDDTREVTLDDELARDLETAVGAALDGIGAGVFPAVPGSAISWPRLTFENCRYCDFERVCPTDRQSEWEDVRNDPDLRTIEVLLKATALPPDASGSDAVNGGQKP